MTEHRPLRSYLGSLVAGEPRPYDDLEDDERRLWHEKGKVLIDPADIDDPFVRQAVINRANQRFGKPGRRATR